MHAVCVSVRIARARRVVVDDLCNRDYRSVDHCAFVRYATDQKLNLDFSTPPRRPQPVR